MIRDSETELQYRFGNILAPRATEAFIGPIKNSGEIESSLRELKKYQAQKEPPLSWVDRTGFVDSYLEAEEAMNYLKKEFKTVIIPEKSGVIPIRTQCGVTHFGETLTMRLTHSEENRVEVTIADLFEITPEEAHSFRFAPQARYSTSQTPQPNRE